MMHINSMAFGDRIGIELNRFRKAYKHLKWESRISRTDLICSVIIAACIDKDEEDKNYYIENEEFGHDVLNIVNCIKDRLSIKLKLDLNAIVQPEICSLIEDDDACDDGSKVTEAFKMAYQLFGEATSRGYERIRKNFNKILPSFQLPSIYMMNKMLPLKAIYCLFDIPIDESEKEKEKEDLIYGATRLDVKVDDENDMKNLIMLTHDRKKVVGAKLDGSFEDYLELMTHKHETEGRGISDGSDIILLNSFDGAEAIKSKDNLSSVISFSSQIFAANQIEEKTIRAGSSFNILTWLQVIGKETIDVLKVVGAEYLGSRKKIVEGSMKVPSLPNSKIWCYDVHDGKMQYELTQHSKWNRKYCPNILCYYQKGDGLKANHK